MKLTVSGNALPLLLALCCCVYSDRAFSQTDSFSLFYQTGVATISDAQSGLLDSLLYFGNISDKSVIDIIGYADEPGSAQLNKQLADERATAVKAYLMSSGITASQVLQCIGKGNILRTGSDNSQRRVDVIVRNAPADLNRTEDALRELKPTNGAAALSKMKVNEAVVLDGLLFKLTSTEFLPESKKVLQQLAGVLRDNPMLKVRIEGHICCGNRNSVDRGWMILSEERAKAVYDYLIDHGINAERLAYAGLGFTQPRVYPERSELDRRQNRRVEIRVVSNK